MIGRNAFLSISLMAGAVLSAPAAWACGCEQGYGSGYVGSYQPDDSYDDSYLAGYGDGYSDALDDAGYGQGPAMVAGGPVYVMPGQGGGPAVIAIGGPVYVLPGGGAGGGKGIAPAARPSVPTGTGSVRLLQRVANRPFGY